MVNILGYGFYLNGEHQYIPDELLRLLGEFASLVSYSVALLEGNLPPNDAGYFPDKFLGAAGTDKSVRQKMNKARECINLMIQKSLIDGSNLKKIYNQIASRVEHGRPTLGDRKLSNEPIGLFE